jgi:eukaryotic-like serine/threonine-protein kinase
VTATGYSTPTDGEIQFWDTSSYARIGTLGHIDVVGYGLAISPDQTMLATLGSYGTVTLWDIATRTRKTALTGNSSGVTCIAFGPGNLLAAGFNDGTVTLWDTTSGKSITALGTGSAGTLNCVAISPDGKTIASGGTSLTIWTVK